MEETNNSNNNPYKKFNYTEQYKKEVERKLQEVREKKTIVQQVSQDINKLEKTLEKEVKKAEHYLKEPRHIRILKLVVIIAAICVFLYIFAINFVISRDFNYFYDIGSPEDAEHPYLTPAERVSEPAMEDGVSYRNLTSQLIYFNFPVGKSSSNLRIFVHFKSNLPSNKIIFLAARDKKVGPYSPNILFEEKSGVARNKWIVSETYFDIKSRKLYTSPGKLHILIDIPHLGDNQTMNYTIPIDWINITVHKPGLLEKYNWRPPLVPESWYGCENQVTDSTTDSIITESSVVSDVADSESSPNFQMNITVSGGTDGEDGGTDEN